MLPAARMRRIPRRSASSASLVALRCWQRSRARTRAATSSGSSGSYISPASIFSRSVATLRTVSRVKRAARPALYQPICHRSYDSFERLVMNLQRSAAGVDPIAMTVSHTAQRRTSSARQSVSVDESTPRRILGASDSGGTISCQCWRVDSNRVSRISCRSSSVFTPTSTRTRSSPCMRRAPRASPRIACAAQGTR
jgi:hypothetical protein